MKAEYDLRGGRPNPYAKRIDAKDRAAILDAFLRSGRYARLDDDVADVFDDDAKVNEALRFAMRMGGVVAAKKPVKKTGRARRSA